MGSWRTRAGAVVATLAVGLGLGAWGAVPAGAAGTTSDPAPSPSWVQQALEAQFHLGDPLPMVAAPWVGTHNSFNSMAEVGPALSPLDPNQKLTIPEQLDSGVRQLEIDVHWFPSLRGNLGALLGGGSKGGLRQPVVCHAESNHAGCTTERTLGPVLGEVNRWLHAHPDDVLLVYLEDHLDNQQGYQTAGRVIAHRLGSLVYRTPGPEGCHRMPLDVSRDDILASGAQVLLVSNSCGVGADPAWRGNVFDWSGVHTEAQPEHGFTAWPDCGPDFSASQYRTEFTRYFEEMGLISILGKAGGWPITAADITQMTRCGVDLLSLDDWSPTDPRLAAMVWSWAPGQPAGDPGCTVQRADGRWVTAACGEPHRVACQRADGSWTVPPASVPEAAAARTCADAGAAFDPPRSGHENQLLLDRGASGEGIWLGVGPS